MRGNQSVDAGNIKREQRQRRMRRVPIAIAPFMAFMGLIAFRGVTSNPRFETIHTLDVIRLMTAGAAFAITILLVIMYFRFPGPGSKT